MGSTLSVREVQNAWVAYTNFKEPVRSEKYHQNKFKISPLVKHCKGELCIDVAAWVGFI